MKIRKLTLFKKYKFDVPQGIQRIDSHSTHGWQVRYQGTKFFSDGAPDGSLARQSLDNAIRELARRLIDMPAPVMLKRSPSAHKGSNLPPGISGPILTVRRGAGTRSAVLSVLLPQFGKLAKVKSVYIGSETTYTKLKFRTSLAKAIALRGAAVAKYEIDAAKSRRKDAADLRAGLRNRD